MERAKYHDYLQEIDEELKATYRVPSEKRKVVLEFLEAALEGRTDTAPIFLSGPIRGGARAVTTLISTKFPGLMQRNLDFKLLEKAKDAERVCVFDDSIPRETYDQYLLRRNLYPNLWVCHQGSASWAPEARTVYINKDQFS